MSEVPQSNLLLRRNEITWRVAYRTTSICSVARSCMILASSEYMPTKLSFKSSYAALAIFCILLPPTWRLCRSEPDLQTVTLASGRTAVIAHRTAGPTLLVLDGAGQSAAGFAVNSGFAVAAKRFGIFPAFGESRDGVWRFRDLNHTDDRSDEEYVVELRNRLVADGAAADAIYLAGYSNGGTLAFQVACSHPDLFAGLAVVSSAMPTIVGETCAHLPPKVIVVLGAADPVFPINGVTAVPWGRTWSFDRLSDFLKKDRNCQSRTERPLVSPWSAKAKNVAVIEMTACEQPGFGTLYKVEGGDHDFYNESYWRRMIRPHGLFLAPEIIAEAFAAKM